MKPSNLTISPAIHLQGQHKALGKQPVEIYSGHAQPIEYSYVYELKQ